ncbi:hypothetical protein [Leisingera aquaemixtae]|jgi:hypothetical protein|uniref:hypothetical protein n=1 Tax=Leisingera aquaemixtae TaxID=1396826 RepID=UPI00114EBEDB|nr:hypothetical protein [Leisingera aquaemixtae]QDI74494.1 hypothetical protein R2C4_01505 [Leisingera aquaemixtae]
MMNFLTRAETGQFPNAITCHSRGTPWHGHASPRAMSRFRALGTPKNRAPKGAATPQLTKCQFWQLNQRLALIAALLREVWTFYEDRRAELGVAGPNLQGGLSQKPAYGGAQSASIPFCGQRQRTALSALLMALLAPVGAFAGDWSSSGSFSLKETTEIRESLASAPASPQGGWNFAARKNEWVALDAFERSRPGKQPPAPATFRLPSGSNVEQLFALIAFAEAPGGRYDAIHHGAKVKPGKKPSQMTLAEIYAWIDRTPGQPHAIGNFQIIPSTLLNLQKRLGLLDETHFNRETQNRMAALLISDAGYQKFASGRMSRSTFMDNLARIWAGLPLASGKSAYHGYAGNRATITRVFYGEQMERIFGSGKARVAAASPASKAEAPSTGWTRLGK